MKPADQSHYLGREQSLVKHLFLQQYLQSAAYKLFQGRSAIFNFVDAFAGPWRNSDTEALSDTSFAHALDALEEVRLILSAAGLPGLKVRCRFCERKQSSVEKLREFAASKPNLDIKIFPGSFEDNLGPIRASCMDVPSFTFTFIDPTGWNVDSAPIFDFLKALRGEVLFNFMSEHINRHASWDGVAPSVGRFVADPNWRPAFEALTEGSIEQRILRLFKTKVQESGAARWLPDFAIRKPRENRIKMRLILGTNSQAGVEVFRNVQEKVEQKGIEIRERIRATETGQMSLSTEMFNNLDANVEGVGCPAMLREAEKLMLSCVRARPGIEFIRLAPDVMAEVPIRMTQLKKLALDVRKAGSLHFEIPASKRTVQDAARLFVG